MAAVLWLCFLAVADTTSYQPNITDGDNAVQANFTYPIKEMVKWIENMRWTSVAVIFDGKSAAMGSLAKTLTSSLPKTTTLIYDFINLGIQTVLYVIYHNLQPRINTVLLCADSRTCWRFLDEAARYDLKSNRTTDFRHHSKWIVLGHKDTKIDTFNPSDYLENVAFFQSKDSRCERVYVYTIHNTMGEHRFLDVPTLSYTETSLFPNMKYGYNNRTLVVSTLPSLGNLEMDVVGTRVSISGPISDILQTLAYTLNFSYVIRPPADKQWGVEVDGLWDGMVGQLQRRDVDLVAADLSVHEDRTAVMDFIMPPIMYSYVEVMYKKVDDDVDQWLLLAKPFKLEVFLLIFACGIMFSILYRLTQSGSKFELSNSRYWYEMLWFTISTLLKQDKPDCEKRQAPTSYGSKLLLGFWLLFLVVIVSIYSANFVAAISVKRQKPPFANLMELVEREDYTLGMPIEGVNYDLFKTSPREDVRKAWTRMKKENETNPFIMSTDYDAHARKAQTGKHAVFMYTSQIRIYKQEDCRLASLEEKVSWQQSAFGVPLQSPLKHDLEHVMSFLVQAGVIQNIINSRDRFPGQNNKTCIHGDSVKAIVITDLLGCFVVVGAFVGLSLVALVFELMFYRLPRFHNTKADFIS